MLPPSIATLISLITFAWTFESDLALSPAPVEEDDWIHFAVSDAWPRAFAIVDVGGAVNGMTRIVDCCAAAEDLFFEGEAAVVVVDLRGLAEERRGGDIAKRTCDSVLSTKCIVILSEDSIPTPALVPSACVANTTPYCKSHIWIINSV